MIKWILNIFLLLSAATAYTQNNNKPMPTLNFLTIPADTRGSGMGNIGVATSADNYSTYTNPAKLVHLSDYDFGCSAGYIPYLEKLALKGTGLYTLNGYRKIMYGNFIGVDLRFFRMAKINLLDPNGYGMYPYSPTEYAITLTYSRLLNEQWSTGVSLRYINSRPVYGVEYEGAPVKAATGIGADIGIYYNNDDHYTGASVFRFGAVIQNIGSKIRYSEASERQFQPMRIAIGTSYTLPAEAEHSLTLNAELGKLLVPSEPNVDSLGHYSGKRPQDISVPAAMAVTLGDTKSLSMAAGMEYKYTGENENAFLLRGGVYYESPQFSPKQLLTFGTTYVTAPLTIDLSYTTQLGSKSTSHYLGNGFKLGIAFNFVRR